MALPSTRDDPPLHLQSLVQPKAYIVTQGPTESTMPDFWRMTWQERASCIVMVSKDPKKLSERAVV